VDDHRAGFEQREPALRGQRRDRPLAVDLAQQRPVVRPEHDVLVAGSSRRQRRHAVRTTGERDDAVPGVPARGDLGEQVRDSGGRRDVLAGLASLRNFQPPVGRSSRSVIASLSCSATKDSTTSRST
jgi:hypothetical protein